MAFIRKAKKTVRKVRKIVKKVNRHPVTKGIASIAKIAQMVKMFNVEKKRVDISVQTANFAQFNGAVVTGGAYCASLTPVIPQGITGSTRNGNSLKLVSACLDIQFLQQSAAINNSNIRWYLVSRPDNALDMLASTAIADFLEPNVFSAVVDYHSNRDPEFFKSYKIIKQGTVKMLADSVSTNSFIAQRKIPLKLNHHLRYNTDASTITTINKFFIIFTQDSGDSNIATGCTASYAMRYYYVDN
jgi:hypothetical protein